MLITAGNPQGKLFAIWCRVSSAETELTTLSKKDYLLYAPLLRIV